MRSCLFAALLVLPLALSARGQNQPTQHTNDAPEILEGPQTPGTVPAQPAGGEPALMTNDTVLRMHRAGLADDLILQTIAAQPGRYTTSPDTLIDLKQAGIADSILAAMTGKARRQLLTGPTPVSEPGPIHEIGLYFKDAAGRWQPMESEVLHTKSSGWIKNTLSQGIIKTDMNGTVFGREAKLLLPRPIEFLIYTPEGVDAAEYGLVRFRLSSKEREFRTLTGGIFHSRGGAKNDEVSYTAAKIAPRTWTFTLGHDTPGAEYGILPPGTGNITNGGKIYTFAISE